MIKNYFKIAWRNIWKNKVFSSINIIGLAISMACCVAISMFIWNEIHFDDFHANRQNIYRITEKQYQAGALYDVAVTPGPLAPAMQKEFPEIENAVRFGSWSGVLKNGTHTFQESNMLFAENSMFSMFNFPLLKGNAATALRSPNEIIITETAAEKYFGKDWQNNSALLGQVFRLNNEVDFKLVGVAKNPPQNSSIRFDFLLPLKYLFDSDGWSNKWNSNNFHTYLQLKAGVDAKAFGKKIEAKLHQYNPETNDQLMLQPLTEQYLYSKFDFNTDWGKGSNIKYVKIFSGVGLLLLIIACVNFVNLSTARSLKRSKEVGVRKINGASRRQLVVQFLSESILIAMLAGIAAFVILKMGEPLLHRLADISLPLNFSGGIFLSFSIGFIVVIGLIAGIYPAIVLSSFKPATILKGKIGLTGHRFRKGLVVFQFAISIAMMICTFFMYRQLQFVQNKDLGFNSEQIIRVSLGGGVREKVELLKNDLNKESTIAAVTVSTMSLTNVDNSAYMEWEGMPPNQQFLITQANIDPGFIPMMDMQLISGGNFKTQSETDTINNFIVNETAVKMMGATADKAIGMNIKFYGATGRIIAVVKDFHFKPLNAGIEPFIFRYQPWAPYFNLFVKTVPGKTAEAINQLQKIYKKYEPEAPIEFSFLNESINQLYKDDKKTASVILLFACLTLFVGCLGLFGLTVFAAEQRLKEIGIRKVLGAGVAGIVQLLSKDFLKLVMLAIIIAAPIAWYTMHQWLLGYAYRIEIDWWVFALAGLVAVMIALFTVSFKAITAAMANPVKSLRTE